ncbi:hypothetical protein ACJMK2_022555 [Sinanodonta woodiana]|uniref:Pre-C2HC domain-containing protein n=1 Tax=Sinanodonta woodiana TaxID=1069815 RepID=A0ABD3TM68_SINWO
MVRKPTTIPRTIEKQTGDLEIPIEAIVRRFEEKLKIKVILYRPATIPTTTIFNGARMLEIENIKLNKIKKAFNIFGFLVHTRYKGCICSCTCSRCENARHMPSKCLSSQEIQGVLRRQR